MPTDLEKMNFANTIYQLVEEKQITHFDAVIYYCEETELELEVAAALIPPKLKDFIEQDAQLLCMVDRTSKLPGV